MQSEKMSAIVINEADNVATAVKQLTSGSPVRVMVGSREEKVTLRDDVPFLHKFALKDIAKGEAVTKYGQPIGEATQPIKKGEHVHSHNMRSRRGLTSSKNR